MDTSANFKIYMCKTVGSNPFFFLGKELDSHPMHPTTIPS